MPLTLTAATDDDGRRLDRILRKALPELPLSAIHRLLRKGTILVNGESAVPARRIRAGETIRVMDPAYDNSPNKQSPNSSRKGAKTQSAQGKIEILFEGAGILVLNKPAGLEVHGSGSLEEQVRSYLAPKLPPSLSFRPGPLHRLDKPSSGIIAFSTNLQGARIFSSLLRERKIKKFYLTLVEGVIEKAETWRDELIREKGQNKSFAADPAKSSEGRTLSTIRAPGSAAKLLFRPLSRISSSRQVSSFSMTPSTSAR